MKQTTAMYDRRSFLKSAGCVAAMNAMPFSAFRGPWGQSPNSALNIAAIGAAGMGGVDLRNVAKQKNVNVVALCDVHESHCAGTRKTFPKAKFFHDYRVMLDALGSEIDAVTVGTPDHIHASATLEAMKRGKHVYCEKPLAHSIGEIRRVRKMAGNSKVVTQMGNQGHSMDDTYLFTEMVRDEAIGDITEIHVICNLAKDMFHAIGLLPKKRERPPVPSDLKWDLWLGPAQTRPYHPMYVPINWRGWNSFGTGLIGDFICHTLDPSYYALGLDAPATILAEPHGEYDPAKHADVFPCGETITFEFPAKGKRGPVKLVWFGGKATPPKPSEFGKNTRLPKMGAVVRGSKGIILHGSHGAKHPTIFPGKLAADYKVPAPTLPRIAGGSHHREFVEAIRADRKACSHFDYGGPLTEIGLLGVIALRFPGQKLEWDADAMRFKNNKEADAYLDPPQRAGWTQE